MTWLHPGAFALLAFIPVVLLLHALRYRRRDVRVSTLFLWDSVLRETHGSLGLHRLAQNLPLLLQLLLVCGLTAVVANPVLTTTAVTNKDRVLVLDVSASMQARTAQGSRFAQAQQRALEVINTLPRERHMALITAGRQPQVVEFFTADKDVLRQAVLRQQPTDAPGNMRDAVLLALSFTQESGTHEVVVIGDGAYGPQFDLNMQQSQVRHIQVGGGERNVGITRMALRPVPETPDVYDILIAVKNFSAQAMDVPLQVTAVLRKPLLERRLALAPGQEEVIVATLTGPLKGTVQAEIRVDDDFPLDNQAYGVIAPPTQTWVLLVGESNYFLETLLTSVPGLLVNVAPQVAEDTLPRLLEANQLIIFNGVQPPPLHRGNFLLLNTTPQDRRLQVAGSVQHPQVLDWQRQHPLLEFLELRDLNIEEALVIRPQGEAQSLIDGDYTSLLSVLDEPPLRLVVLPFDLMRSDLPLRVAFPILMQNLLRWLSPQRDELNAGYVQAGMSHTIFFDKPVSHATVQDPQGRQRDYNIVGNPWVFSDTQRAGVYIIRAGEAKHYLVVNLLDDTESDLNPTTKLPSLTPQTPTSPLHPAGVVETPLWLYGLLGAVVMLLGEWYVWCRDI
jgi:hypothetical protein